MHVVVLQSVALIKSNKSIRNGGRCSHELVAGVSSSPGIIIKDSPYRGDMYIKYVRAQSPNIGMVWKLGDSGRAVIAHVVTNFNHLVQYFHTLSIVRRNNEVIMMSMLFIAFLALII
ncbi:hypothetical protein TNCV_4046901 [Trichonephila clavipes]|nr:hypothetical protein TNCV_4046901 [Trichonephila clavipes]